MSNRDVNSDGQLLPAGLVRSAMLRVENSDGTRGAAFAVARRIIVTAQHLTRHESLFRNAHDRLVNTTLVQVFPDDDFAVYASDEDLPFLSLAVGSPHNDAVAYGFPALDGVNGLWAVGKVLGETLIDDRPRLQVRSGELTLGFSGAPLYGRDGVVGLVVSVIDARHTIAGRLGDVAFAVPACVIAEHLRTLNVVLAPASSREVSGSAARGAAIVALSESRARCFARFRAANLDDRLAEEFAHDDRLALFPNVDDVVMNGGLRFVIGDLGGGKSLGLERTLQRAALRTIETSDQLRIIYVDARSRNMDTALDSSTLHPSDSRLALFVDNAEAVGPFGLDRLVDQLRALHFRAPKACIVMTSRPAGILIGASETLPMPLLPIDAARSLVRRIAPFADADALLKRQAMLAERPLFLILAAQHPGIAHGAWPSPGDLLTFLGQRVLSRLESVGGTGTVLRRLGVLQTDAGGDLVPLAAVAQTMERAAVVDSGYVTYDGARQLVGYTLPVLTQWFAAQALEVGEIRISEFVGDELRLENWRDVFMLRIATSCDDEVDSLFRELVIASAGFAASLAHGNVPRWFAERDEPRPSAQTYARRLRNATCVWLAALGSLAAVSPFADDDGPYALGAVIEDDGRLRTGWRIDRASETFELELAFSPLAPPPGFTHWAYHRFIDLRPAWNWMSSATDVRKFLESAFEWREYASARGAFLNGGQITFLGTSHEHELAWQAALGAFGHGSLATEPIMLQEIVESGVLQTDVVPISGARYLATGPLRSVTSQLSAKGDRVIGPPWPVPEARGGRWIWSGYTDAGMLRRVEAVYRGALELYERIVRTHFGRFANRMPLFAAMPLDFRITVFDLGNEDGYAPPDGEWSIFPLRAGPNAVTVKRGELSTPQQDREVFAAAVRVRPELRIYGTHGAVGILDVFGDLPISELTYRWLRRDIARMFGA